MKWIPNLFSNQPYFHLLPCTFSVLPSFSFTTIYQSLPIQAFLSDQFLTSSCEQVLEIMLETEVNENTLERRAGKQSRAFDDCLRERGRERQSEGEKIKNSRSKVREEEGQERKYRTNTERSMLEARWKRCVVVK